MPKAPQRCSLTCRNIKGKCPEHKPVRIPWENSKRNEIQDTGSSEWKRQRRRIIFREQGKCQICGESDSRHVDHIIPAWYTKKSTVEDDELQLLCKTCHDKKSSFEGVQAKRIKRASKDL